MIFFFCGAPKNGSHFQLFTVTESLDQQGIAYIPKGGKLFDHRVYPRCRRMLDELEEQPDTIFVLKGHWSTAYERRTLLSYRSIKVFHIWRDLRDALVSTYFYERDRFQKPWTDFADYYRRDGRLRTIYLILYERRWRGVEHPQVHHTVFKRLRLDFPSEAGKLLSFAGLRNVDLDDLEKRISLERLRKRKQDPDGILLRKGAIGDHSSVIDSPEIYREIDELRNLSSSRLLLRALQIDPRVILSGKFGFPGRRALLRTLRALGAGRKRSPGNLVKKGRPVWWD